MRNKSVRFSVSGRVNGWALLRKPAIQPTSGQLRGLPFSLGVIHSVINR